MMGELLTLNTKTMYIFKRGETVWYQQFESVGFGEFICYDRGRSNKASFKPLNSSRTREYHGIDAHLLFKREEGVIRSLVQTTYMERKARHA